MPALDNPKHELFCEGLARGLSQRQAYVNAGFSEKGADASASRLIREPLVNRRLKDLKLSQTKAACEVLTNPATVFVANAIRERQYRLTLLQDLVDRLGLIIKERAEAYKDSGPGGSSGLLVMQKKTLGTGPREVVIDELVIDGVVISQIRELAKQAAIECGDWEEKHRIDARRDEHPDIKNMTAEQMYAEREILMRAKAEIDALRAQPAKQIEAAQGSVEEVHDSQS